MIESYLLEELVAFAQAGTLAQTAATLHVTQPTVTRGMQKLETELGVRLFDRQPNRITLTATGQLAAERAASLLAQERAFVTAIQHFDRTQTGLTIASTLPGPLLVAHQAQLPHGTQVVTPFQAVDSLAESLTTYAATVMLSDQDLQTATIESRYVGTERLAINLDKFMYQANQPTIRFAELRGLSFLVLQDIGVWRHIIQTEIPDAQFMYQAQRDAFLEITKYSDFPYFSTNLSPLDPDWQPAVSRPNDNRVRIPISDDRAQMPIYASYLTSQRPRVRPVIDQLMAAWPAEPTA